MPAEHDIEVGTCQQVCFKEYHLNIDSAMTIIDRILSKYVPPVINTDVVWYVKGLRHPLSTRKHLDRYKKEGLAKNTPWHPYLAIPILQDMLEYYQYRHTNYPELFKVNPMANGNSVYSLSPGTHDATIILSYYPGIDTDDLYEIANIFLDVYETCLKAIFTEAPDHIYRINIDTNMYRLCRLDDIRAYRYDELLAGEDK